jgi:hypothetical protein
MGHGFILSLPERDETRRSFDGQEASPSHKGRHSEARAEDENVPILTRREFV